MDGCKLRELDDVQWIQVKSLSGTSVCNECNFDLKLSLGGDLQLVEV